MNQPDSWTGRSAMLRDQSNSNGASGLSRWLGNLAQAVFGRRSATVGGKAHASGGEPPVLTALSALDEAVIGHLQRAVALSENSVMEMLGRLGDLRALSSQLVGYLSDSRAQSDEVRKSIEANSRIINELAQFVHRLPQQLAHEQDQIREIVTRVKSMSNMTGEIRNVAKQTEILAVNAAVEAARAGEAGRGFAVLAVEVRRLANRSNDTAAKIDRDIRQLVDAVEVGYGAEFEARAQQTRAESARLSELTVQLDSSYNEIREFYKMLLAAVTSHNVELDNNICRMLDTGLYQDVFKQIIDRVGPALQGRHEVIRGLVLGAQAGLPLEAALDQVHNLTKRYAATEANHGATGTSGPGVGTSTGTLELL